MPRLLLTLVLGACALSAQMFSEKEAALGKALAADTSKSLVAIANPDVSDYVDGLVRRLSPGDWHIVVVENEIGGSTNEPTALPGGYLFIPSRLLLAARTESEFAGMLAHAMAHVLNRHGLRQSANSNATDIPLIFMSGWTGKGDGPPLAVPIEYLGRQHQFELDADARAVRMMASAGFSPAAFVDYLDRTQSDPARPDLSQLPSKSERLAALHAALPPATPAPEDDSAFRRVQEALRTVTPPAAPRPVPSLRHP